MSEVEDDGRAMIGMNEGGAGDGWGEADLWNRTTELMRALRATGIALVVIDDRGHVHVVGQGEALACEILARRGIETLARLTSQMLFKARERWTRHQQPAQPADLPELAKLAEARRAALEQFPVPPIAASGEDPGPNELYPGLRGSFDVFDPFDLGKIDLAALPEGYCSHGSPRADCRICRGLAR
jgi:hypothetical protein